MTNFLSDPFENATVSSVDVVNSEDGAYRFGNENLASFNFDGAVPTVLDDAFEAQYLEPGMYFVVPGTDDTLRSVVEVSLDEDDPLDEMTIVYVGENSLLSTYTCDGSDFLTVQYESWSERVLGTQGWTITSGGNAIFSNVAVRGDIEAQTLNVGGANGITYDGTNVVIGASVTILGGLTIGDVETYLDDNDYVDEGNLSDGTTIISGGNILTGTISANRIQSGVFVTGTDLGASGTTTIDGGRITTGTISASRLDLSGVLTATDVGDSGSTIISGSRITTGSLSGDRISGGTITGTTIQSANSGRRVRISGLGGTDVVEFLNSSGIGTNIGIGVDNTNLYLSTSISGGKFICVPPVEFFSTLSAGQITNETSTVTTVNFYRNSATTGAEIMRLRSNVGGTGQIKLEVTANGTVRNSTGVYGTLSDERYKENLTLARNYLDDINKIKIFKYNLVNEEENFLGVSAQQVQTIFPNLVEEDNEGKLNVKTSVFIPMLISSVQELSEKVKDLQDRVLQLESQLGG